MFARWSALSPLSSLSRSLSRSLLSSLVLKRGRVSCCSVSLSSLSLLLLLLLLWLCARWEMMRRRGGGGGLWRGGGHGNGGIRRERPVSPSLPLILMALARSPEPQRLVHLQVSAAPFFYCCCGERERARESERGRWMLWRGSRQTVEQIQCFHIQYISSVYVRMCVCVCVCVQSGLLS